MSSSSPSPSRSAIRYLIELTMSSAAGSGRPRGRLAELAVEAEAAHATEAVALGRRRTSRGRARAPSRAAAGCPDAGGCRSSAAPPRGSWPSAVLVQRVDDQHVEVSAFVGDDLDLAQIPEPRSRAPRSPRSAAPDGTSTSPVFRTTMSPTAILIGDGLGEGVLRLRLRLLDDLGLVEVAQDVLVGRQVSRRARAGSVIAENLPDWSMRTVRISFLVTLSSIHEPRSGMIQQLCSLRSSDASTDEVDARRAVELAHDHALGAVDDELAARRS